MLNLSLNNFYINPKYILNQAWIAPKPTPKQTFQL